MRDRRRLRLGHIGVLFGAGGLVACVGGGGDLPGGAGGWEGAPTSLEAASPSTDGARVTNEPPGARDLPPGTDGSPAGGPAACVGTFVCEEPSEGMQMTVTFTATSEGCSAEDVVLTRDGSIREKGKPIGSWTGSGGALSLFVEGVEITCVRSSGQGSAPPPSRPDVEEPPPRSPM